MAHIRNSFLFKVDILTAHSSILARSIPRTEKPGRLQSMRSQRVRHDWVTNTHAASFRVGLPRCLNAKESTYQGRRLGFDPWVRKIPWSWKWQPTPIILAGKFHRQRVLVGCSPGGHKELDMTEPTHVTLHIRLGCVSLIPSFIDAHLGCFYLLALVNNAPVNMGVQISLWDPAFNFGVVYAKKLNWWIIWQLYFSSWGKPPYSFLQQLHRFASPPTVHQVYKFSASLLILATLSGFFQ